MNLRGAPKFGLGVAIALLCLTPLTTAKTKIVAQWPEQPIAIDGEIDEWREALVYVKSVDAFVAAFNDRESLYLCLYSQSPDVARQIASDGLRVRFESGEDGAFVVHYPKGSGPSHPRAAPASPGGVVELEIPGRRDRVAVTAGGEAGIRAAVSHRGSFVYELEIPLVADESRPWALGLQPGERFKIVIENPQVERVAHEEAGRGRPSGGRSPHDAGVHGPTDPSWGGRAPSRIGTDQPFYENRFVFLLKARIELADAPN